MFHATHLQVIGYEGTQAARWKTERRSLPVIGPGHASQRRGRLLPHDCTIIMYFAPAHTIPHNSRLLKQNYVYLNLVIIILMVVVITMCWLHYSDGGIHVQSPMRIMIMSIMQMLVCAY